jgi:outer membrane protein TolC
LCLLLAANLAAQVQSASVPQKLTLDDAMQLALKQNPTLLREKQNLRIANANVRQARLLPNPDFDLNSESYPLFESHPGSFFDNQELTFRAGQTLETAGKRSKRTLVARQELSATGSDLDNTMRQLKLELKRRYYTVVLAKAQRDLAQENLKQFDEIIKLNEARYKQGELSGLEINRVRAERLRFFTDLLDADLQLNNAKTALLELLPSIRSCPTCKRKRCAPGRTYWRPSKGWSGIGRMFNCRGPKRFPI